MVPGHAMMRVNPLTDAQSLTTKAHESHPVNGGLEWVFFRGD